MQKTFQEIWPLLQSRSSSQEEFVLNLMPCLVVRKFRRNGMTRNFAPQDGICLFRMLEEFVKHLPAVYARWIRRREGSPGQNPQKSASSICRGFFRQEPTRRKSRVFPSVNMGMCVSARVCVCVCKHALEFVRLRVRVVHALED